MTDATTAVSPLRRRMIDDMTLRNLSPATQRSYLHAVAKFSRYFDRSPDQLGLEDVRAFQVYLVSQGISWPALYQTVCALRFFYGVTLNRAEIPERIAYARTPRTLPTILSADEVVRFLEAVPSLKARAALTTAYAAGLTVIRFTIQPGAVFPWHTHPGTVLISVTEGDFVFMFAADCERRDYPAGTALVDPGDTVHTAWNPSPEGETVVVATLFGVPAEDPLTLPVDETENARLDKTCGVDRG